MKPIRVNIDFEEMLLGGPARPSLCAGVEFLSLWVQERPLLASRTYSKEYLDHVKFHTGLDAKIMTAGEGEDWWGDLVPLDVMRKLSSKTEFLKWWQSIRPMEAKVCHTWDELECAIGDGPWLAKKSDGMSGRGHVRLTRAELPHLKQKLMQALEAGLVVEPFLERTRDISALWLPEEKRFIYYRNEIDGRFQWRGSLIAADELQEIPEGTGDWFEHLRALQARVAEMGYLGPFSVDAFYYRVGSEEIFHPGSEMNPRKTMGWVTYQLWKNNQAPFAGLCLQSLVLSEEQWRVVAELESALLLSPENGPFVWFWIEAESPEEWQAKREEFLKALPAARVRGRA